MKHSLRGKSTTVHIVIVVTNWKLLNTFCISCKYLDDFFGHVLPIHLNLVVYQNKLDLYNV